MSSASASTSGKAAVSPTALGWEYIHWGLGLFITGFITGFIPILHYMKGASGNVGAVFLKNVTLWWGCPGILAELTLKTGGLGMMGIGLAYLATVRQGASASISGLERTARTLCTIGLIAELVTAAAGYAICNRVWPNFFFEPVQAGKNVWLTAQGLSILVYVFGICYASAGLRKASSQLQ